MIVFVIVAAGMVAIALGWVLVPLLRRQRRSGIAREASNVELLREQLAELDADLAAGAVTKEAYGQARRELEQRVLEESRGTDAAAAPPPLAVAWTAAILGAGIPIVAIVLYVALGSPDAFAPAGTRAAKSAGEHDVSPQQIEAMAAKLAAKLEQEPGNVEGWVMLGRTYYALNRHADAARAFEKALALTPDDAALLADYADAMAVVNDRNLEGEPSRLIARALELEPDNLKALSLAGTAAFMRKDYALALRHWEKMQQVAPDSEFAKQIQGGIDEARRLAAASPSAPAAAAAVAGNSGTPAPAAKTAAAAGAESIRGVVKLSAALAGKAAPQDTLFVYARPAQGPRMPLAIVRKQVKDLPLQFTLDDTMAMSPAARLSSAQQVVVSARISKSGNATPQAGDLLGQSAPVPPGTSGLTIEIGQVFNP